MKFIMATEQEKSDRDFERQAAYDQYVGYSKSAARVFTILIVLGLIVAYKSFDRAGMVLDAKQEWRGELGSYRRAQQELRSWATSRAEFQVDSIKTRVLLFQARQDSLEVGLVGLLLVLEEHQLAVDSMADEQTAIDDSLTELLKGSPARDDYRALLVRSENLQARLTTSRSVIDSLENVKMGFRSTLDTLHLAEKSLREDLATVSDSFDKLLSASPPEYIAPDYGGELQIPSVGFNLPMRVFLNATPPVILLLTIAYWIFLRSSATSYRKLIAALPNGASGASASWPSIYNLPLASPLRRVLWQGMLELIPIPFWLALGVAYYLGVSQVYGLIMGISLLVMIFLHTRIQHVVYGNYIAYFRRRYHKLKELERGSAPPSNSLLPRKR